MNIIDMHKVSSIVERGLNARWSWNFVNVTAKWMHPPPLLFVVLARAKPISLVPPRPLPTIDTNALVSLSWPGFVFIFDVIS